MENAQFMHKNLGKLPANFEEFIGTYILKQWLGRFLRRIGRHPSDSKSNRLHVDIFRFSLMKLGYVS